MTRSSWYYALLVLIFILTAQISLPRVTHAALAYTYVSQFNASSVLDLHISTTSGNIYAVDAAQGRADIFSPSGTLLSSIGSSGSSDGQSTQPSGMAFDSAGNIYMTDNGGSRVQKFNSAGTFLSKFGTSGTGNGQFGGPYGIAVSTTTGNIYVADPNNNRIQVFSSTTAYVSQFGSAGSGNGQFNMPLDVSLDFAGNIYVADSSNNRVQVFSSTTAYIGQFGTLGTGNGQFNGPEQISFDPNNGNIYVADTYNSRVEVFDPSWSYLGKVDNNVPGLGLNYATSVAVSTTSTVYVGDFNNNRIETFKIVPPAVVQVQAVSSNPTSSVVLNGSSTAAAYAASTDQGFQYGLSTGYGLVASSTGSFGSGTFSQTISNLICNTTYHYRAFVTNPAGTAVTNDQTFLTTACPASQARALPQSTSSSGGSISNEELAKLLAPSAATTAYLNSRGIAPTASSAAPVIAQTPMMHVAAATSTLISTSTPVFTMDLSFGMTDHQVKLLQSYLNAHGFLVASSGPGSSGHETDLFGLMTVKALKAFQAAHNISSTGNFGPMTRASMNGK